MNEKEPYLLTAVKSYKQELEAIEELRSTGLVTPNRERELKHRLKAKYRELIDKDGKDKATFDCEKSIYEIAEMFVQFWREHGRKYALEQLQDFYRATPRHKEKAQVWKKVVAKMASYER